MRRPRQVALRAVTSSTESAAGHRHRAAGTRIVSWLATGSQGCAKRAVRASPAARPADPPWPPRKFVFFMRSKEKREGERGRWMERGLASAVRTFVRRAVCLVCAGLVLSVQVVHGFAGCFETSLTPPSRSPLRLHSSRSPLSRQPAAASPSPHPAVLPCTPGGGFALFRVGSGLSCPSGPPRCGQGTLR